jgi:YggT family protein
MSGLQSLIRSLLQIYVLIIIGTVVLSYFPAAPESTLARVQTAFRRLTEPVLAPIRRFMPRIGGAGMMLDLSPIVALLLIQWVLIPIV